MNNDTLVKKRSSDIYLSDNDIKILKKYKIDYENYSSFKELLFSIDDYLDLLDTADALELEDLLIKLSEYNYYFRTNK